MVVSKKWRDLKITHSFYKDCDTSSTSWVSWQVKEQIERLNLIKDKRVFYCDQLGICEWSGVRFIGIWFNFIRLNGILLNDWLNASRWREFVLDTYHTKIYHDRSIKISTRALPNGKTLGFGSEDGVLLSARANSHAK